MSTIAAASGPSGGELGRGRRHSFSRRTYEKHPDLVRRVLTIGMHPRAGHDRARWESVNWEDYRAHVGVQQRRGPWRIEIAESPADGLDAWAAEAQGLPHVPGWYTTLVHDERGLVMSDLPGEVAGALPFLDRAATQAPASILITGLGLGIVPAWLLSHTSTQRIDIVEIDADIIALITGDTNAREKWAGDPRSSRETPRLDVERPGGRPHLPPGSPGSPGPRGGAERGAGRAGAAAMMLTLEARFPCILCACQLRQWSFPTARINRRSIRITGPSIIAGPEHECPECGTPVAEPVTVRYRLTAESQAEVEAYRARRWPQTRAA